MKTAKSNLIIVSVWLKPEIKSVTEITLEDDILNISMESHTTNKCYSVFRESDYVKYKFIDSQDDVINHNLFYFQQALAFSEKYMPDLKQAIQVRKRMIPIVSSEGFTEDLAVFNSDELDHFLSGKFLPASVTENFVSSDTRSKGFECRAFNQLDIDRLMDKRPIITKAIKNNLTMFPNKTNHQTEYFIDDLNLADNQFLVLVDEWANEYKVYSKSSLEQKNSLTVSQDVVAYKVQIQPPALRIPLYHIDIQSAPQIEGVVTPKKLLDSLVGKLDGTKLYQERYGESIYGKAKSNYSSQELISAMITAKIKESDLSDSAVDQWNVELPHVLDNDSLKQFNLSIKPGCVLI